MTWAEIRDALGRLLTGGSVTIGVGPDGRPYADSDIHTRRVWLTEHLIAAAVVGLILGVILAGGRR